VWPQKVFDTGKLKRTGVALQRLLPQGGEASRVPRPPAAEFPGEPVLFRLGTRWRRRYRICDVITVTTVSTGSYFHNRHPRLPAALKDRDQYPIEKVIELLFKGGYRKMASSLLSIFAPSGC
jgi:hypothetical protein